MPTGYVLKDIHLSPHTQILVITTSQADADATYRMLGYNPDEYCKDCGPCYLRDDIVLYASDLTALHPFLNAEAYDTTNRLVYLADGNTTLPVHGSCYPRLHQHIVGTFYAV